MLAFANVVHLFTHEFAGLSRWRLAFAGILLRALQSLFFGHRQSSKKCHMYYTGEMHCPVKKM